MAAPGDLRRPLTAADRVIRRRALAELRGLAREWLDRGNAFVDDGQDPAVDFCYGVAVTLDHYADRLETEMTL